MRRLFILFICIFSITTTVAQGLNNDYDLDEKDIKNLFELLEMETFKFKLPQKEGESIFYNIIFYSISADGKSDTLNLALSTKKYIDQYGPQMVLPQSSTGLEDFLRVYSYLNNETLNLTYDYGPGKSSMNFDFSNLEKTGSRAFDTEISTTKQTRIMAFYGSNSNEPMHCALNDTNEALMTRMDKLLVIYLEPYLTK